MLKRKLEIYHYAHNLRPECSLILEEAPKLQEGNTPVSKLIITQCYIYNTTK